MVIEEKDFRLTYSSGNLWDLELLKTIRPKGKPARQEFQDEGYGMRLPNCIYRIINHRLENKQDVYTLKEYMQDFIKELDQLSKPFNELESWLEKRNQPE